MKINNTNSKNSGLIFIVVMLFFLIILSSQASAWGVYPARQHAENNNNLQEFQVTMVNGEFKEGYFKVIFSGGLSEYVKYNGGLIHFTEDTTELNVSFLMQLNGKVNSGKNVLNVVFQEVSNEYSAGVGSTIALVAEVVINVPFEGNVVSAQVQVQTEDVSDPVKIAISVLNKGESAIPIWADVVIKGPTNDVISSWSTERTILAYSSTGGLETYWVGDKNPGAYVVEATLRYGDEVMVLRKSFTLGSNAVVAESITANNFALGQIVPMDIVAFNQWNTLRQDVFGEIFVVTKDGGIVQSFKTSPEDVPAIGRKTLSAYWDTSRFVIGEYDLNVLMHYDDKTSQERFPVVVSIDKLNILNRVSGNVISQGGSGDGGSSGGNTDLYRILIILIIVLIVVNASWIFIVRKSLNRGDKKKK